MTVSFICSVGYWLERFNFSTSFGMSHTGSSSLRFAFAEFNIYYDITGTFVRKHDSISRKLINKIIVVKLRRCFIKNRERTSLPIKNLPFCYILIFSYLYEYLHWCNPKNYHFNFPWKDRSLRDYLFFYPVFYRWYKKLSCQPCVYILSL